MKENQEKQDIPLFSRAGIVHFLLSHSYLNFLLAVILGSIMHIFLPFHVFKSYVGPYIGFAMLMFGTIVIYWAQYTSNCTAREFIQGNKNRDFARGPYKFTRNPTHAGLIIMTLGLGVILNSFFIVLFVAISAIFAKVFFLKEEEKILEEKYGEIYCDYKKRVKNLL